MGIKIGRELGNVEDPVRNIIKQPNNVAEEVVD
jgi:hypothetical protein